MKLLLLNPPHPAIGSRIPQEHLPPLGLLALGGPLIDAGHRVSLLDADLDALTPEEIIAEVTSRAPQALLIGHSGSTSGHPGTMEICHKLRQSLPNMWIIYGGVYPSYHWEDILRSEPQIDVIVRGEGEETITRVVDALEAGRDLGSVKGIAFRPGTVSGAFRQTLSSAAPPQASPPAPIIHNLDKCRVGWELIDHTRYSYWGDRRAVVVQFSRGCPHQCNYCGQRFFWRTWRHRNPQKFAAELARLHREQGVEVINFADENPTANRKAWRRFLEALIAENVHLILVGSTRATDIVRDADILSLYKRAGVARLLMGMESTDENTLRLIQKGSTQAVDREAIRLLRNNDIVSMAAYVAGFARETDRDYWRLLRQIISYDPDQIQALYATPHAWTPFARQEAGRRVIQTDLSHWDYKHQVLESPNMPNWRVLAWMKAIEAVAQLRPRSLWRTFAHPDAGFRAAMQWYYKIGFKVWPYELRRWFTRESRTRRGPLLSEFNRLPAAAPSRPLDPGPTRELAPCPLVAA